MAFDLEVWRRQIQDKLEGLPEWRQKLDAAGIHSLYAALSAMALWPAVVELGQGDSLSALIALGAVAGSVGGNLLANRMQSWKDEVDAARDLGTSLGDSPDLLAALDAVLEQLGVLEQAQESLPAGDREGLIQTLREELGHLGNLARFEEILVTGERAVGVAGDVEKSILITGDNSSVNYIVQHYLEGTDAGVSDEAALQQQIGEYIRWACDRFGTIELRGIKREGQQVVQLDLDTVYVPLQAYFFSWEEEVGMEGVLALGKRLAITGGPGCGKTTVLHHIASTLSQAIAEDKFSWAQERTGLDREKEEREDEDEDEDEREQEQSANIPLPILVPLSSYANHLRSLPAHTLPQEKTLAAYISRHMIEQQSGLSLPPDFFARLLRQGQAVILLLDGLDGVPDEDMRARVREAVERLVTGREEMRVVVTCRTAAFRGRTVLGRDFQEVQVLPLDGAHVERLVRQAYAAIYPHDPTARREKAEELLAGIEKLEEDRRRRLGDKAEPLVTSPLIVRMFLVVHFSERRLPEQRAELYMKAVDAMLLPEYQADEEVAERIGRMVGGSREVHRELVQHLAFHMHQQGETQGRDIGEDDLRAVLAAHPSHASRAEDLIGLTRLRGTLLEERDRTYRFIHLGFQEYLVARYLAEVVHSVEKIAAFFEAGLILDDWWREPALLVAGYLAVISPQIGRAFLLRLAGADEGAPERLPGPPADVQVAAAEVAAVACLEWQREDVRGALAGRLAALFGDKELFQRARPLFRAAAGDVLGRLGDPRFRSDAWYLPDEPLLGFVDVGAGPFMMGTREQDIPALMEQLGGERGWYEEEVPQHELTLPSFYIARYPVTVAQFGAFVAAGGYGERRYWVEAEGAGYWREGWVKGRYDDKPRERPEDYGEPYNLPNHPVVGTSWYEALAYARWLTDMLRQWEGMPEPLRRQLWEEDWEVRLPTEAEWEKAARGRDGRVYPWGDRADPKRANYEATGIGTTSAVGCFLGGAGPYGVEDQSGNVWEWCSSLYGSYPYRADDGREDLAVSGGRILRGGAWPSDPRRARCVVRDLSDLHARYDEYGFRVLLAPVL